MTRYTGGIWNSQWYIHHAQCPYDIYICMRPNITHTLVGYWQASLQNSSAPIPGYVYTAHSLYPFSFRIIVKHKSSLVLVNHPELGRSRSLTPRSLAYWANSAQPIVPSMSLVQIPLTAVSILFGGMVSWHSENSDMRPTLIMYIDCPRGSRLPA